MYARPLSPVLSQSYLGLTKFIEQDINIYDTQRVHYQNIFYDRYSDIDLVLYKFGQTLIGLT